MSKPTGVARLPAASLFRRDVNVALRPVIEPAPTVNAPTSGFKVVVTVVEPSLMIPTPTPLPWARAATVATPMKVRSKPPVATLAFVPTQAFALAEFVARAVVEAPPPMANPREISANELFANGAWLPCADSTSEPAFTFAPSSTKARVAPPVDAEIVIELTEIASERLNALFSAVDAAVELAVSVAGPDPSETFARLPIRASTFWVSSAVVLESVPEAPSEKPTKFVVAL